MRWLAFVGSQLATSGGDLVALGVANGARHALSNDADLYLERAHENMARQIVGAGHRPLARVATAELGSAEMVKTNSTVDEFFW